MKENNPKLSYQDQSSPVTSSCLFKK